jgi:hypothetical protein
MAMGVVLNPTDTAKLEGIRDRESDIIKERIQYILKAGANVILTTKGIDALCLKYCMFFSHFLSPITFPFTLSLLFLSFPSRPL